MQNIALLALYTIRHGKICTPSTGSIPANTTEEAKIECMKSPECVHLFDKVGNFRDFSYCRDGEDVTLQTMSRGNAILYTKTEFGKIQNHY